MNKRTKLCEISEASPLSVVAESPLKPNQTETGAVFYEAPQELSRCKEMVEKIILHRAESRLLDIMEEYFRMNIYGSPHRSIVLDIAKLLRKTESIIAGSAAVKALLGTTIFPGDAHCPSPPTAGWQPDDLDIFCMPNRFKEVLSEVEWILRKKSLVCWEITVKNSAAVSNSDSEPDGYLPTFAVASINILSKYWTGLPAVMNRKIQIITHRTDIDRPYCDANTIKTAAQMIKETFDLSICTAYYDGHNFHYDNPIMAMFRISSVRPMPSPQSQAFTIDSARWLQGRQPRTGRPYRMYTLKEIPMSSDKFWASTWDIAGSRKKDSDINTQVTGYIKFAFDLWLHCNKLQNMPNPGTTMKRLAKYLDRELDVLYMGMQLAEKKVAGPLIITKTWAWISNRYHCAQVLKVYPTPPSLEKSTE